MSDADRARPLSVARVAFALALLLGLQPATTDIILPALPALTRALGTSISAAQLTMSALILAFGAAQLVWGPVADRVGRRPVLLWGLGLYVATTAACAAAPDIGVLIAARAAQGACLAAAVVCARAMVRDLYEPQQGAQVMALGLTGLGVVAITGPLLGGWLVSLAGWRSVLVLLAIIGAFTLLFVARALPESLTQKNPLATRLGPLLATWRHIASHPRFIAWAALVACTYGGLFTILAGSSFVYIDVLGVSTEIYGLCMAAGSISYLLATLVCRKWIARLGLVRTAMRGAGFSLGGGLGMWALAAAGVHSAWAVLIPQCIYCFGHGFHQPCGQTGAVGPFPQAAGAASALAGFTLAVVAFGVSRWLGVALNGTVMPLAQGVAVWSILIALVAWTLVRRQAESRLEFAA